MTSSVVSALQSAMIAQVADLLLARAIKHIPVVADERLVGMVSRRDLMRAMIDEPSASVALGDDAVCTAVRARLQADLGVAPEAIETSIRDGLITLRGEVENSLERDAVLVAAESVPGVRDVSNNVQIADHTVSRMKPASWSINREAGAAGSRVPAPCTASSTNWPSVTTCWRCLAPHSRM